MYYRAWKKHLRSASRENQLSMYQTLCLLESEVDINLFHTQLSLFTTYWESKEPKFMEYFKEYYQDRAGMISIYMLHIGGLSYFTALIEKWARYYRHFEHGDTDTNMFLERYMTHVIYIHRITTLINAQLSC